MRVDGFHRFSHIWGTSGITLRRFERLFFPSSIFHSSFLRDRFASLLQALVHPSTRISFANFLFTRQEHVQVRTDVSVYGRSGSP